MKQKKLFNKEFWTFLISSILIIILYLLTTRFNPNFLFFSFDNLNFVTSLLESNISIIFLLVLTNFILFRLVKKLELNVLFYIFVLIFTFLNVNFIVLIRYFPNIFLIFVLFLISYYVILFYPKFSTIPLILILIFYPFKDLAIFLSILIFVHFYYKIVILKIKPIYFLDFMSLSFSIRLLGRENLFFNNFIFSNLDKISLTLNLNWIDYFSSAIGFDFFYVIFALLGIFISQRYLKKYTFVFTSSYILILVFSFLYSKFFAFFSIIPIAFIVSSMFYYFSKNFKFSTKTIEFWFFVLLLANFMQSHMSLIYELQENSIQELELIKAYEDGFFYKKDLIISNPKNCMFLNSVNIRCIPNNRLELNLIEGVKSQEGTYFLFNDFSILNKFQYDLIANYSQYSLLKLN